MSKNQSSKSLALFVTNSTISYLTKTIQQDEFFYSEIQHIKYNTNNNKETDFEEIRTNVKTHLPLLLYYDEIIVCYLTTPFYIVPNDYFTENTLQAYQLNTNLDNHYIHQPLKQVNAQLVFNVNLPIHHIFNELANFKNARFLHLGKLLIDDAKVNNEKIQIFAQLINQKLELCIYNKGIFMLYNIFDIINDDDIIYYILNATQQLELDPTQIEVQFESGLTPDNTVTTYLEKYVQQVHYNEKYELLGPKYLLYKIFECE